MTPECLSHHHACECRERSFQELVKACNELLEEYDDRAAQFGDDYLWKKHEDASTVERARGLLRVWKEENPCATD